MPWKLFLLLIFPCSSSVAVLAVNGLEKSECWRVFQRWHSRSGEVSVLVAPGEWTEMVLCGLSLKKNWYPAVRSGLCCLKAAKKLQLQRQWAALSWENLWAGFSPLLSSWMKEAVVTSQKFQFLLRFLLVSRHQGRSQVWIPCRTELFASSLSPSGHCLPSRGCLSAL